MTAMYYNGVRWFTNPHLLQKDGFGWAEVILHSLSPKRFKMCRDPQVCLDWYASTIHTRNEMGMFEHAFSNGEAGDSTQAFQDPDFGQQHPTLHAFLTSVVDDDGKKRRTSTLLIFCEDGCCKGVLKERVHDLSLWVTARSILGVFEAAEEALCKRPIEWRRNNAQGGGTSRKWK